MTAPQFDAASLFDADYLALFAGPLEERTAPRSPPSTAA
jgi:hypothetical protein